MDTGADVSIVNARLVIPFRQELVGEGEVDIQYSSGKRILVQCKIVATISPESLRKVFKKS